LRLRLLHTEQLRGLYLQTSEEHIGVPLNCLRPKSYLARALLCLAARSARMLQGTPFAGSQVQVSSTTK
jgi:hypothetical protein